MTTRLIAWMVALLGSASALAANPEPSWQQCSALPDTARLACYDNWARQQAAPTPASAAVPTIAARDAPDTDTTRATGCKNTGHSPLSRFWELERGSNCDTFGIRGYRPISLSVVASDSVNTAPSTPSAGHTASYQPYQRTETRIQLSVRTKIAQGLLTPHSNDPQAPHDSLWFGYTQQSYWQLFNGALSRPFRNTDHEPEVMYVYPSTLTLPAGWQLRYSGAGIVHQSNGQSLPLSRSWNRVYLMAGAENGNNLRLTGRVWQRLPEKYNDDNPDMADRIGRGEIQAMWDINPRSTLGATVRRTLAPTANGSLRLEWLRTLGDTHTSGLRLHTQLFSGYGDSLVDYNRRRVTLSIGLSLVDF